MTCLSCGAEVPDGARFCLHCGAALAPADGLRQERKVVTILFCDLVGSTALGEDADPEDVDLLLRRYNATVRAVVRGLGGTVEKFIGDAVFAVFGVPVVHEDDPVRAVQAGLRLVAAVGALPPVAGRRIQVRVGVSTGEVLVRLDIAPGSGEGFLAGDAVNVGARLQSAAPPMGVVVGPLTHRLTRHAVAYEPLPSLVARGKRDAIEVWLAKEAMPASPRRELEGLAPLVGRSVELSYLTALLDKATGSPSPQVVLVLGEPGIGKTRLVTELSRRLRDGEDRVRWLEARCQPYGENRTYAALGQIVKGAAGILETDDADTTELKLDGVMADEPEGDWVRNRLRPLVGLEAPVASRTENHAAWLTFLERLAAATPLVLCFEDLQWADEPLLAFLEFLTSQADAIPLLTIATARPDLLTSSPSFAASSARVTRVWLERLSDRETAVLVSTFPGLGSGRHEVVEAIVRRSEGNPYFAEELARLFSESAVVTSATVGTWLPDSVQAVLAARIDGLSPSAKARLGSASVIGDTFRRAELQALGEGAPDDVGRALDELVARRLVRIGRQPADGGGAKGADEYAFCHALIRDVTYNALPRLQRAVWHETYARWLEANAGEHADDFAAMLAHHFATAAELAPADAGASSAEVAARSSTAARAVHYLALAGDRAMNLDAVAAAGHYARALTLAGDRSGERLPLLTRWAEALVRDGRYREGAAALEEAAAGLQRAGELRQAALTLSRLGELRYALGDDGILEPLQRALALLERDQPSPEQARVFARWGKALWFTGDPRAGLQATERALALSAELSLPEPAAMLGDRGGMRCCLGDPGGHDDYRRAILLADEQGLEREHGVLCFNYSDALLSERGPTASARVLEQGIEWARRRRIQRIRMASKGDGGRSLGALGDWDAEVVRPLVVNLTESLAFMGRWDEVLATAAELVPQLERGAAGVALLIVRVQQAMLYGCRGEPHQVEPFLPWLDQHAREGEIPWMRAYAALSTAQLRWRLGDEAGAVNVLSEWAATDRPGSGPNYILYMTEAFRAALAVGGLELAESLPAGVEPLLPMQQHVFATIDALTLERRHEYEAAAHRFAGAAAAWRGFDVPYEQAQALLGGGRCLTALERTPEAAPLLKEARVVFERLGARPALDEVDVLVASAVENEGSPAGA